MPASSFQSEHFDGRRGEATQMFSITHFFTYHREIKIIALHIAVIMELRVL